MTGPFPVLRIPRERGAEAEDVLWEAFRDYPTTRYVIGASGEAYDRALHRLAGYFVEARLSRGEPVLAIEDAGRLAAVATVTPPGRRAVPPGLAKHREDLWRDLGPDALERYEAFGRACAEFAFPGPHTYLNMIGVRRSHAGRGLGRRLLDAVHALSRADAGSSGVALTTEDAANVPLYRHVGYEIVGHARISDSLEAWGFFRPDDAGSRDARSGPTRSP